MIPIERNGGGQGPRQQRLNNLLKGLPFREQGTEVKQLKGSGQRRFLPHLSSLIHFRTGDASHDVGRSDNGKLGLLFSGPVPLPMDTKGQIGQGDDSSGRGEKKAEGEGIQLPLPGPASPPKEPGGNRGGIDKPPANGSGELFDDSGGEEPNERRMREASLRAEMIERRMTEGETVVDDVTSDEILRESTNSLNDFVREGQANIAAITDFHELDAYLRRVTRSIHFLVQWGCDHRTSIYEVDESVDDAEPRPVGVVYSLTKKVGDRLVEMSSGEGYLNAAVYNVNDIANGSDDSVPLFSIADLPLDRIALTNLEHSPVAWDGEVLYEPSDFPEDVFHLQGFAQTVHDFFRDYGWLMRNEIREIPAESLVSPDERAMAVSGLRRFADIDPDELNNIRTLDDFTTLTQGLSQNLFTWMKADSQTTTGFTRTLETDENQETGVLPTTYFYSFDVFIPLEDDNKIVLKMQNTEGNLSLSVTDVHQTPDGEETVNVPDWVEEMPIGRSPELSDFEIPPTPEELQAIAYSLHRFTRELLFGVVFRSE